MPIIEVEHLTKEYQLGTITSIKDSFTNALRRLTGKPPIERERFKALDDVSFSVEEGEVVGIIGHNGAGKSTLLKILAKVTTPTKGRVVVRGSIAPLIEVGAGINPELTGRENIYLNASILGIPKKVIKQKIDEIIEFSELEQFIDTPVKRYSSGMQVKLGFAIATSLDAEILIIDEVLAVGDLAFQRKCFDRIERLIKRKNCTVLIVSHNIRQIERICTRAILLDHGKVIKNGSTQEVCGLFYEQMNKKIELQAQHNPRIENSGEISLVSVEVLDKTGTPTASIRSCDPLHVRILFDLHRDLDDIEIVVGIHRTDFIYITASSTREILPKSHFKKGIHEIDYILPVFPLLPGIYSVRLAIVDKNWRFLFNGEFLKSFTVTLDNVIEMNNQWKILNLPANFIIDKQPYISPQAEAALAIKQTLAFAE
jgi:ABC-type polysaccharide/polyol phosphate transport system ATPase subunit